MDYAIVLCFDKKTESNFNNMIKAIADDGVSSYMIDKKIPPHVTLCCFCTEDIETVIRELEGQICNFRAGDIVWASLGAFVPCVLFASPVMNEYLLNACIEANRLIEPLASFGGGGHYLPYQWVPHTTLATQLNHEKLNNAFDIASQQFTAISGKSNRLLLVECNPYLELKAWDLI